MATKKKVQIKQNIFLTVTDCPKDTQDIYVVGDHKLLGNWDVSKAVQMAKYDDGDFGLTIDLATGTQVQYKYLSSKSWDNVECGYVAQEIDNRSFTANETKIITDSIKGFKK